MHCPLPFISRLLCARDANDDDDRSWFRATCNRIAASYFTQNFKQTWNVVSLVGRMRDRRNVPKVRHDLSTLITPSAVLKLLHSAM